MTAQFFRLIFIIIVFFCVLQDHLASLRNGTEVGQAHTTIGYHPRLSADTSLASAVSMGNIVSLDMKGS